MSLLPAAQQSTGEHLFSFKPCKSSPWFQWGFLHALKYGAQSDSLARGQHAWPRARQSLRWRSGEKQLVQRCNPRRSDTLSLPGDSGQLGLTWRHGSCNAEPGLRKRKESSPATAHPMPRGAPARRGPGMHRERMLWEKGIPNPGRSTPLQSPPSPGGEEEEEEDSSPLGMGPGQPLQLGVQDGH